MTEEIRALREEFAEFRAMLLTPDNFVRYERLPQLVGSGIEHAAGSEEVNAVADRWEYVAPNVGSNGGLDVVDLTVDNTDVILDTSIPFGGDGPETGKLLGISCWCGNCNQSTWGGARNTRAVLYITVDGGTPQHLPITLADLAVWDFSALLGWAANVDRDAAGYSTGGVDQWGWLQWQDAFRLPFNFEYKNSLKVHVEVTDTANWANDDVWELYVRVDRARLVA